MIGLERLLGPGARVERSKWRVSLYQKRVVGMEGERYVLYRFFDPRTADRLLWLLNECERRVVPLQRPAAWTRSPWEALKFRGFWVATDFARGEPILAIASPAITRSRPPNSSPSSPNGARQRGSRSTAITFAPALNNARVSPPGPGPTS